MGVQPERSLVSQSRMGDATSVGQVIDLPTILFGILLCGMYKSDLQNYLVGNLKVCRDILQHLGVNVGHEDGKDVVYETCVRDGPPKLAAAPLFHRIVQDADMVPDDFFRGRRYS